MFDPVNVIAHYEFQLVAYIRRISHSPAKTGDTRQCTRKCHNISSSAAHRPAVSIEPYAAATHRYALNTIRASDDEANAADAADDDGADGDGDGALKGDRATVDEMRHLLPCMQMCAPQAYRLM